MQCCEEEGSGNQYTPPPVPMANKVVLIGGYDCNFEEEPPSDLLCLICLFPAKDAMQLTCCGKIFCSTCLHEYSKKSKLCPNCRSTNGASFKDQRSDRHIKSLRVKCSNDDNGCNWKGEVSQVEGHAPQCTYRMIVCPNMCMSKDKKPISIMQKDVQQHLETECRRRLFQCPHCQEMGEHVIMTGPHLKECQHIKVTCPNDGCREKVKKLDLSQHRTECPHEKIGCKYELVGCKITLRRREMEKHENTDPTHLLLAMEAVLKQHERIRSFEGQLARISSANNGKFTFKMASFTQHKTTGSLFFSPSFYSSPGGYKMCIRVVANGDGQGKETHISVYAVVMKGDYDDSLEWPIKGTVIVELLNQLQDDAHHAIRFSYPEGKGDVSTQRVMAGDRAKRGYGKTRFIPYTELEKDQKKNCQYLKDDSLYFRVTVETMNPKPWLACSI